MHTFIHLTTLQHPQDINFVGNAKDMVVDLGYMVIDYKVFKEFPINN